METAVAPVAAELIAPAASGETTVSAVDAAIGKSPADYRAAKRAERAGKPLPAVTVAVSTPDDAPAPVSSQAPAPPLSRKEREQQDANERTRKAVEAATADLRAELDRVKASVTAPRSEPVAPLPPIAEPPAPERFPSLDVWAEKNPGKTFDDYLDARDEFRTEQNTRAQQVEQSFKARAEDLTKRGQVFGNAMGEALKAEPDLAEKIPPAMRDPQRSVPLSAMSPKQLETATFSNLVAEAAFRAANGGSGKPGELLKYLHAHQDETVRIANIAARSGTMEALMALERLDERIAVQHRAPVTVPAVPAVPAKLKKITSAAAAPETLGSRPAELVDPETAAVKGSTRDYRQFRREQRASGLK